MRRVLAVWLAVSCLFVYSVVFMGCKSVAATSKEVRACWVSSVGNLDFPSKQGLSAAALTGEINSIVKNCSLMGINTIFFQVRPTGDALYFSEIFPWSAYVSGKQGVAPPDGFDPLRYFIKQAKNAGIELHAWINPYRIGTGEDVVSRLCSSNPAVLHPEYTVNCDSGLYYNPGIPEARELILKGIEELVRNYNVDGIHFDDYFYPYDMSGFDDSQAYRKYGNGLSLEDFRRESVNQLVSSAYKRIKRIDPRVQFGISPFGIWANQSVHPEGSQTRGMNAYSEIFADSKRWVEEGWVDYICPQIYWSDQNNAAPYRVLVDWWSALCKKNDVPLYVGIGAYKVGTNEAGWKTGNVLYEQLKYASSKTEGHCFFRYGVLIENENGILESVQKYYGNKETLPEVKDEITVAPITSPNVSEMKITSPAEGQELFSSAVSVCGVANPEKSVYVNGVKATSSKSGFFSAYVPLKSGENLLTVSSGTQSKRIRVMRKEAPILKEPDPLSAFPSGTVIHSPGDCVEFSVRAPKGYTVVLKNSMIQIPLTPSAKSPESYTGLWTVPVLPVGTDLVLDKFRYEFVRDGAVQIYESDLTVRIIAQGYSESGVLVAESHIYDKSNGGSQMDHDPLREGAEVHILASENDRYLLSNGFWVSKNSVGTTRILRRDTANYLYDVMTISSKEKFSYSSAWKDGKLEIFLSKGGRHSFEIMTDSPMLSYLLKQGVSTSELVLSYADASVMGYEIVPQKNRITVYLRRYSDSLQGKTVLLDAGHGGSDSGAYGPGGSEYADEAALNLSLTDCLKNKLEEKGATVMLTRAEDCLVSLDKRAEMTEKLAPDIMISLHLNSVDASSDYNGSTGGLVLYSVPLSETLASCVASTLGKGIYQDTVSVRRQSLKVCRQTECPAILVEGGYLCNPQEYEMLLNRDIHEKMAQNIVEGLEQFFVFSSM